MWGSRTEGGSQQAGGEGPELRGMGEAALTPPPPSVGKQRGFSLPGLMMAAHLKGPVTSLVPGGLQGKRRLLVPPPARRREGEDRGLPEAGALHRPGRAWPLHPPGPVAHLLGGHGAGPRYPWFLQGARVHCAEAGDPAGPGRFFGSKRRFYFYLTALGQRPSWKSF